MSGNVPTAPQGGSSAGLLEQSLASQQTRELIGEFMAAAEKAETNDQNCDWMVGLLAKHMEQSEEDVKPMRDRIVSEVQRQESFKESLQRAKSAGLSRESWLSREIRKAAMYQSTEELGDYFGGIDKAINDANEQFRQIVTTQSGEINANPNLDGNIAEGHHVNTYNIDAAARDSEYHAEMPQSNSKNSVDILVKDKEGKVVKRYQSKYGKDAETTKKYFEQGDYRGQQKLVPEEQQDQIEAKTVDKIETEDGAKSKPLSKTDAQKMRDEVQKNKQPKQYNWNEDVDLVTVAKETAAKSVKAGAFSVAMTTATMIGSSLINGEEVDGKKIAKKAIVSGASTTAKTAATAAVTVAMEKGLVPGVTVVSEGAKQVLRSPVPIPKPLPLPVPSTVLTSAQAASVAAGVVSIGIEGASTAYKVATGEMSVSEAVDAMQDSVASTAGGLVGASKGAAVGATLGAVFGPVGSAVGGFAGSVVGGIAGSYVCRKVSEGVRAVTKTVTETVKSVASAAWEGVKSVASSIGSAISSFFSFW